MKLRNSFVFNLAIVAIVAALFTIPGEAKQPDAGYSAPAARFGLFLDPHVKPLLQIEIARNIRSF
jgi:hypothetical protein